MVSDRWEVGSVGLSAMELWHNPRCSKSRQAQARLDEAGVDYIERRYIDDPPTVEELSAVVAALGIHPRDLVRRADARKAGVDLEALGDDPQPWLQLMMDHPALIERPILLTDDGRAVIGRPTENLETVLP